MWACNERPLHPARMGAAVEMHRDMHATRAYAVNWTHLDIGPMADDLGQLCCVGGDILLTIVVLEPGQRIWCISLHPPRRSQQISEECGWLALRKLAQLLNAAQIVHLEQALIIGSALAMKDDQASALVKHFAGREQDFKVSSWP